MRPAQGPEVQKSCFAGCSSGLSLHSLNITARQSQQCPLSDYYYSYKEHNFITNCPAIDKEHNFITNYPAIDKEHHSITNWPTIDIKASFYL